MYIAVYDIHVWLEVANYSLKSHSENNDEGENQEVFIIPLRI